MVSRTPTTRQHWVCEDCRWDWPLGSDPPPTAECDNCGGALVAEPYGPQRSYKVTLMVTLDCDEDVITRTQRCASVSVAGDWCALKAGHTPLENVILDGRGMHRSGGLEWEGTAR